MAWLQVVANGRALAFMKEQAAAGQPVNPTALPAAIAKGTTPGGTLVKETAGKPWVLNVDAMLADFLQNKK